MLPGKRKFSHIQYGYLHYITLSLFFYMRNGLCIMKIILLNSFTCSLSDSKPTKASGIFNLFMILSINDFLYCDIIFQCDYYMYLCKY